MIYQIQFKRKGGSWIRDQTKYQNWSEAYEDACTVKEYCKTIEKIEVVCGEED